MFTLTCISSNSHFLRFAYILSVIALQEASAIQMYCAGAAPSLLPLYTSGSSATCSNSSAKSFVVRTSPLFTASADAMIFVLSIFLDCETINCLVRFPAHYSIQLHIPLDDV